MIVGRIDQCISERLAVFDHVIEPDLRAQAQQPGHHRAGQVGIDDEGANRAAARGRGPALERESFALRLDGSL